MLNDCTASLEKLRAFLVGKTVKAVDKTTETESIFRITLMDDSSIRIHATDLGWWTQMTTIPGVPYQGLVGLFLDYGHHHFAIEEKFNFEVPEPSIKIESGTCIVQVVAADGREFQAVALTDWEKLLIGHPEALVWLGHALREGDMWRIAFQSDECPSELQLSRKNVG